jgi:hypothetical protein
MEKALRIANGEEEDAWDEIESIARPCAEFMMRKIEEKIVLLKFSNNSTRSLKLAE